MNQTPRYAQVAPDVSAPIEENAYTYEIPEGMRVQPGDAVLVPFGARTVSGFVLSTSFEMPAEVSAKVQKFRAISSVIQGLNIRAELLDCLKWISSEYLAPLSSVVAAAMPPGLRPRLRTDVVLKQEKADGNLSTAQHELLELIQQNGGRMNITKLGRVKSGRRSAARALIRMGILETVSYLPEERRTREKLLRLADADSVSWFIAENLKKKPAQAACLQRLAGTQKAALTAAEISETTGASSQTIKDLFDAGMLLAAEKPAPPMDSGPNRLTSEQKNAIEAITRSIRSGEGKKFLLFGVTGSGKTEVYLRCAAEALSLGKQVLYLVPEIALTPQTISHLRGRFGNAIAVMHSAMSAGERLRHWRMAREGATPIVVGARSAIFAPLENIGLIVIDEEHESSYKQDSVPRYHVRAVAEFRAAQSSATVVMGSATPAIESFHRTTTGEIERLTLPRRATDLSLPEVSIADLREGFREGKPSLLGAKMMEALEQTFERQEQALLFLNRRAYSHGLVCRDCGHCPKCPNCSVALVFHLAVREVRCHHCGFKERAPKLCPVCGGTRIRTLGIGTEKVEEFVRAKFPGVRAARLDRDVASRRGAAEEIFLQFRAGEIDVLIGTQMIAKGLDFPNVSLVGVVMADVGLAVPDFRSTERTFQLLTQVAGRAGRHRPGRVMIQTFQPEHPAIRHAATQAYEPFFEAEIGDRKITRYPPFVRLANIVATSENYSAATAAASKIAAELSAHAELEIAGPSDCPISRLAGQYRRHLVVKFSNETATKLLESAAAPRRTGGVRITVDIDPQSLL